MVLSGKTCLITGANSGLGLATVKGFAKENSHVIMVCRDRKRGEEAKNKVQEEVPDAKITLLIHDLSSMDSTKKLVEEVKEKYSVLDILFNNAAVMKRKRTVTNDGIEMMFQVNYLAPLILTTSFTKLLEKSSLARVINIGVPSEKLRLELDDLQAIRGYAFYTSFFKTKLCLLLSSLKITHELDKKGISVIITDPGPGSFKSNLVRDMKPIGWIKNLFSKSVEKVADNVIYLASSEETKGKKEIIFMGKKETPLIDYWKDEDLRKNLWNATEVILKGF
ncbi:MAG: SDR family NAD(P)-dependent oxidoreductase [Candidatus Hodarchaeales archaeon]|jgi:NAD(P)-dependent dehydrogenase (short-subunit alcohol dehydrogenase family)